LVQRAGYAALGAARPSGAWCNEEFCAVGA
jgi:hypothetical protein